MTSKFFLKEVESFENVGYCVFYLKGISGQKFWILCWRENFSHTGLNLISENIITQKGVLINFTNIRPYSVGAVYSYQPRILTLCQRYTSPGYKYRRWRYQEEFLLYKIPSAKTLINWFSARNKHSIPSAGFQVKRRRIKTPARNEHSTYHMRAFKSWNDVELRSWQGTSIPFTCVLVPISQKCCFFSSDQLV